MILRSSDLYELIESNPRDKYLPSYLVLVQHADVRFHVLFACDVPSGNVRVVTAYIPDGTQWKEDLKTRRTP